MTRESAKITVFYDGACGLCAKEIAHYQNIAPAGVFHWIDITRDSAPFTERGYKVADGLKALHVEDRSGAMHLGVDGFIVIWQELKRWRILATLMGLPGIRHAARFAYRHFARWRFKKLGYETGL